MRNSLRLHLEKKFRALQPRINLPQTRRSFVTTSTTPTVSTSRTHTLSSLSNSQLHPFQLLSHSACKPLHPTKFQSRNMASAGVSQIELAKKAAAFKAVDDHLLPSYKYVGIGSGSTVVYVVDAIKAKGPAFYDNMIFFPTGSQSKGLIRAAGLKLCNLDERPVVDGKAVRLDVAFDGADEIDAELNLIKGGGACLFQEKLVAVAANKFIAVADSRKQSPRLCTTWKALPLEVLPMAAPDVLARLQEMGSIDPKVRSGLPSKAGECVTDNGMWIIDAPFPPLLLAEDLSTEQDGSGKNGLWEVSRLADELAKLPGIVEIGLFYGVNGVQAAASGKVVSAQKPIAAYFGMPDGSITVQNAA